MLPKYKPGDHVLTFRWASPKVGDVVVFRSLILSLRGAKRRSNLKNRLLHSVRNDRYRYFIKRVDKYVDNYVYVSGDNRKESAKFEAVKFSDIIGKVILKY